MNKLFICLSWLTIFSAIIGIAVVTYWLIYPYQLLTFNDAVFPVVNKTVKSGGTLRYVSDYCKYTDASATVTRSFVNEIIFVTPTTITNRPTGCAVITVEIALPKELPIGTYHLSNTYTYEINPLRTVVIKEDTEEFKVVE